MFTVSKIASRQLLTRSAYNFGLGGSKRKPTPNDLDKYDIVVVGGHLGNVAASHIDMLVGEQRKIFLSYDQPTTYFANERTLFEQGQLKTFEFGKPTRPILCKNNANSDSVGVQEFHPESNEVTLRNGRKIKYDSLIIAMGQKDNYSSIKGFEEAWVEDNVNFHTNQNHPTWRISNCKPYRVHLNFNGGEALYYIPPGINHGEISDYNFFTSKSRFDIAEKAGKFSWENSSFSVINPNKTFSKYLPKVDQYIRDECSKRNINIEENLILEEVRASEGIAVFRDVNSNQTIERRFGTFYSLMPTTTHSSLSEAGLADSTGYLDVDQHTLQHKKYDNIFGLGDVINVPTTKTFFGGINQVHVVKNNVLRRLNGLPLSDKYNGYAKANLLLSASAMATVEHEYNGDALKFNTDGVSASFAFKWYFSRGKHTHENALKIEGLEKHKYTWNKWFGKEEGTVASSSAPAELQPEKKAA